MFPVLPFLLQNPSAPPPPAPLSPYAAVLSEPAEVISSPNWQDFRNYPPGARDRDEEGAVVFRLSVGPRGIPESCSIVESSGVVALDAQTCNLAAKMRFKPKLDAAGQPRTFGFSTRVVWLLQDQRVRAPTWIDATISFNGRWMTSCETKGAGAYFKLWSYLVCKQAQILPFKKDIAPLLDKPVVLSMRVGFEGFEPGAAWPEGKVLASDETRFTVNGNGDISGCTPEADGDIFSNDYRSNNACGHFLASLWLKGPDKAVPNPAGHYQLRLTRPTD